ncbi:hypothetical protein PF010_g10585 [Phytophthora fragariae]|uniref:Uncharacterized protein n=1 Tax=Phytophthora fragariae TaxID=53985 RepID=A0A6A3KS44_9STRA|nr:hypothetical protein PF011_g9866 [Phytophthora fragariae]KAE9112045.1 hypothetical protein PF010_g10585 [Phytophthora fragariae]KAE9227236.1 hypothetical protein PF004_g11413 [Phytophthora fragariae]KAE9342773.1 hypothetical protein PF008_g10005 [Phytophthora fragariae]
MTRARAILNQLVLATIPATAVIRPWVFLTSAEACGVAVDVVVVTVLLFRVCRNESQFCDCGGAK